MRPFIEQILLVLLIFFLVFAILRIAGVTF